MNSERKLRSIPCRTMRDVWRERGNQPILKVNPIESMGVSFGGIGIRGTGQEQPQQAKAEQEWVNKHTFRKPIVEKQKAHISPYEDDRIKWQTEIVEDCDTKGDLGIIMQFIGVDLSQSSFVRSSRNYGSDKAVFYTMVGYKGKLPFLILATYSDILEAQIVPKKKDVNPLFLEEIFLPQLSSYNPASMSVSQNQGLVIVEYKKR